MSRIDSGRETSEDENVQKNFRLNNFKKLLHDSTKNELCEMYQLLMKLLKIDIITELYDIGEYSILIKILKYAGESSIIKMELVSKKWKHILYKINIWRYLILEKIEKDKLWKELGTCRNWYKFSVILYKIG